MTRVVALLVLAACGAVPTAPPQTPTEPPITPSSPPGPARVSYPDNEAVAEPVAVPRPDIGAPPRLAALPKPDPSDHLRWPLTKNSHPALEPTYAIAPVFAAAGVSWTDLCRVGAQNRRSALLDQTEYLKAWCDVGRREITGAVTRLGPLMRSTVLGLAPAARIDIANILVDAGDADQAVRVLAAAKITDVSVLDMLAASYIEVGMVNDGAMLNELAIGSYDFQRPADQCERLTRRMLMASVAEHARNVPDYGPYLANRSCALLAHAVACWATRECAAYLTDQGVPGVDVDLLDVYFTWPETAETADTWWRLGELAYDELGTPGADVLATAAYEGAIRSEGCSRERSSDVRMRALKIKLFKAHDTKLDPRLDVMIDSPWLLCGTAPP